MSSPPCACRFARSFNDDTTAVDANLLQPLGSECYDLNMGTVRSGDVVTTFLSCSVRPHDWPIVDALVDRVLAPAGFRCFTVGRNSSFADQTDAAIRQLMNSCECLIGVATERLNATDRDFPSQTLRVATPYLLQETSMAFQAELPFLIFKATGISLLGVTNRNLWIEIDHQLSRSGRVTFHVKPELLLSALRDLKQKALQRRAKMATDQLKTSLGWLSTLVVGGIGLAKGIDMLTRPNCFGDFYYRDAACKPCTFRDRCKIEKMNKKL